MALVAYLEHKLSLVDVLHTSDNFGRGLRFLLISRRLCLVEVICEVEGWERTLFAMTWCSDIHMFMCMTEAGPFFLAGFVGSDLQMEDLFSDLFSITRTKRLK